MTEQIKRKRVLLQPTKDQLKDQLALAAKEIIRLRAIVGLQRSALDFYHAETRRPWWRRLLR